MSNIYGYIYLTINKINNKKYIGQHKGHWNKKYYGSGIYLKRAIQKYGIENFDHYPLTIAFNKNELNQLEIDFISYYKPEYNIARGGEGGSGPCSDEHKRKIGEGNKGKIVSEETRKRMSEAHKGKQHTIETKQKISKTEKGKILSEETKQKMSVIRKGKPNEAHKAENHPMFGKQNKWGHHSQETKQKLSALYKGKHLIIDSETGKRKWAA